MHLPKAACDEGGVGGGGGAHYIAWRTFVPVLARRAGGQIFPAPLTAFLITAGEPALSKRSSNPDGR